jgi:hypothetical protein
MGGTEFHVHPTKELENRLLVEKGCSWPFHVGYNNHKLETDERLSIDSS